MELEKYSMEIETLTTREKELLYLFATSKYAMNQLPSNLRSLLIKMGYPNKSISGKILTVISSSKIRDNYTDRSMEYEDFQYDERLIDEIVKLEAEIELRFEKTKETYLRLGEIFCSVKEKLEELYGVDTGVQKGKFGREKSVFKKWWTERGYDKNLVSNSMKKYRLYTEHEGHPELQDLIKNLGPKPVGLLTQEEFKYKRKLITATLYKMHRNEFKNFDAIEEHLKGRKYKPREVDKLFQEVEKNIKHYTPEDKEILFTSLDAIKEQLETIKELHKLNTTIPTFKISKE